MANPVPISVDEARLVPNRLQHSGRQKGGWVYLDADLLRRAGMPDGARIEVMRYALVDRVRRKDGSERVRGRIILNLRMLLQQEDEEVC